MLFTEYETFKTKNSETLQETITRLTILVNEISSLDKTLTIEKQDDKVLRILSKVNWDVKVTAIEKQRISPT